MIEILFLKNRSILLILMSFLLLSFSPYNDSFSPMKIIDDTPSIKSNNFEYINYIVLDIKECSFLKLNSNIFKLNQS